MLIIGLTGSFGTGKTTVAKIFKKLGAKVIDADKISHHLFKPQTYIYKKILDYFGPGVLKQNSRFIDRNRLAAFVFGNRKNLEVLTKIIHPEVIKNIRYQISDIKYQNPKSIIIIDAPLLIEAGLLKLVDRLIVVKTDKKTQLRRIKERTGLTDSQIRKRIKMQLPLKEKIKLADFVVDNNGRIKVTEKQVREIWRRISQNQ